MTQAKEQSQEHPEIIIRFSSTWWAYIFFRLGLLRAFVNGIEDALAITGRFLLLVFLIYCGAEAGLLLSNPNFSFPAWLQMGMFILQLAGLEGSIPGLARQADTLRIQTNEDAAKNVERVMLSARVMTVLAITEGALHALHVPPMALQIISAILLVVRGIVITGFLIALAKIESKAPRVLSKDAHARELEQQALRDEQTRTMEALRFQLDGAEASLADMQRKAQQNETDQAQTIEQLREQVRQVEAARNVLLTGTEHQGDIMRALQSQLSQTQQHVQDLTAALERKQTDYESVTVDLQSANLQIVNLQTAVEETANLPEAYQLLSANLQTANLQIADLTAKLERAKGKMAHLQTAGRDATPPAKNRSATITSIDQVRAKLDASSGSNGQGRAKISHAEVVAFMNANPGLKRAEVAERLSISERKVYDAIAWAREQENQGQEDAASAH